MRPLALGLAAATLWIGGAVHMAAAQNTPGATMPAPGSAVAIPDQPSLRPRTPAAQPGTGTAATGMAGTAGMDQNAMAEPPQPQRGHNDYTRSQATYRIASQGYENVSNLRLGRDGVWRGQAVQNGQPVKVWLDHTGTVGVDQPPVPPTEPASGAGGASDTGAQQGGKAAAPSGTGGSAAKPSGASSGSSR